MAMVLRWSAMAQLTPAHSRQKLAKRSGQRHTPLGRRRVPLIFTVSTAIQRECLALTGVGQSLLGHYKQLLIQLSCPNMATKPPALFTFRSRRERQSLRVMLPGNACG